MKIQIIIHTNKGLQSFVQKVNKPFSIFHEDTGFAENTFKTFVNEFLNKEKLSLQNPSVVMDNIKSINLF